MMFLVTIAMLLLCWSVVRQRRIERQRRESGDQTSGSASANPAVAPTGPVDSPEFDDAVFVQLPGDEKPQFFALPKPFVADATHQGDKTTPEVADDGKRGEKEQSAEEQSAELHSNRDSNAVEQDPCAPP